MLDKREALMIFVVISNEDKTEQEVVFVVPTTLCSEKQIELPCFGMNSM
jgi:hypothetical protein